MKVSWEALGWSSEAHFRRLVVKHFKGATSPRRERALRAHLEACARCRAFYDQVAGVSSLDPSSPSRRERLARGLGFTVEAKGRGSWRFFALAVMAACGVMLFVGPWRHPERAEREASEESGFVARGSAVPATSDLVVFAARGGRPTTLRDTFHASDELAFGYRNADRKAALMIFSIDEHGHVYWYHPAWNDPATNPAAIPISREPGWHELPVAVAHDYDGGRMVIHALFTDLPLTVRQVEQAVASRPRDSSLRALDVRSLDPGAVEVTRSLDIVH